MKRDGIPTIDNPQYISAKEVKTVYFTNEPVIVIENSGYEKAIPLNILNSKNHNSLATGTLHKYI